MKKIFWLNIQKVFPIIGLGVILIVFSILSGGKLWSVDNLKSVMNTMIPICIGGTGFIFVSAQGSTNISIGSTLAFCGALGAIISNAIGFWAFVPTALLTGVVIGVLNGFIVAKLKVSSIMVTLAVLIGVRALVTLLTNGSSIYVDLKIMEFNKFGTKMVLFVIIIAVFWYLFEHTKLGYYSKCMGENEMVGKFSGIPVDRYKILAFVLAGLASGLVSVFSVANICGASATMGNFFEMTIMIAMYVAGIPVEGGAQTKFYKLIIGSLTLAFLQNGLTISRVDSAISELIQGIILLLVVFTTNYIKKQFVAYQMSQAAKMSSE